MHLKVKIARIGGVLYLLIIIFGLIAQIFVRDNLVDYNDATITAKRILSSEFWYRFGFVSELFMLLCDVGVTTVLFILLKEANTFLCVLSTLFRFASITILGVVALTHFAALSFLKEANFLDVFSSDQRNALALLTIKTHGMGYNISLLFFGFHLLVLGRLTRLSGLFPKPLVILLLMGGVCYIFNSIIWFLFPNFINVIYPAILIPCALGEWIFCFYLLTKGSKLTQLNPQSV
jgi:hypothetical protein